MIFVDNIDVFLFYEENTPRQVYLTAEILNKQLKIFIDNDKIIYNNMIYLDNIFNILNANKPKTYLDSIMDNYSKKPDFEQTDEYKKIFTDFGTIKHWIDDTKLNT